MIANSDLTIESTIDKTMNSYVAGNQQDISILNSIFIKFKIPDMLLVGVHVQRTSDLCRPSANSSKLLVKRARQTYVGRMHDGLRLYFSKTNNLVNFLPTVLRLVSPI